MALSRVCWTYVRRPPHPCSTFNDDDRMLRHNLDRAVIRDVHDAAANGGAVFLPDILVPLAC